MKKFNIKDFLDSDEEIVYEGQNSNGFIVTIVAIFIWLGFPKNTIEELKIFGSIEILTILICTWQIYRFIFHRFYITNKSLIIKQKNVKKIYLQDISDLKLDIYYGRGLPIVELQLFLKNNQKISYLGLSVESGRYIKNFLEEKIKGNEMN